MSTTAAVLTVLGFLQIALPTAWCLIRRYEKRVESVRDQVVREARARAVAAALRDDTEPNAGCDRLRAAIHQYRKEEKA